MHGNAFERHTRANGKYPEERRPPRYIIPSGFFFVHSVAEETAKGPTKKSQSLAIPSGRLLFLSILRLYTGKIVTAASHLLEDSPLNSR